MATDELLLLLLMMMKMMVMKNAVGVFKKKGKFQTSVMKSKHAIKNSTFKFGTTHIESNLRFRQVAHHPRP